MKRVAGCFCVLAAALRSLSVGGAIEVRSTASEPAHKKPGATTKGKLGDAVPRLIEDPVEIPCVFRIGRFCLVHDSWWISHRRRSRQARRVGARWLCGVAGDAPGQRLGAVGRWMELSGSRRCVVDGRRHDPWLAQTV